MGITLFYSQVTSTEKLEASIATIKAELASRNEQDLVVLNDRLCHIEDEVNSNGPVPLSLEHLELYLEYLERVTPCSDEAPHPTPNSNTISSRETDAGSNSDPDLGHTEAGGETCGSNHKTLQITSTYRCR